MSNCIIIGGKDVPLTLPGEQSPRVLTWKDHHIEFKPGQGFNKARTQRLDLAVWHWTGGEQEPLQMVETLRARGLGVEFATSRIGEVFQFADPLRVDTADAAGVNARSVGIEIVSYGMVPQPQADWLPPLKGRDRAQRTTRIHDVPCTVADFYPAQLRAAMHLADALSRSLGIPRAVPLTPAADAVLARKLLPSALLSFAGHIGHYHVTRDKCDPGPAFIDELWRHFGGGPAIV
jgi:hypothetical protein